MKILKFILGLTLTLFGSLALLGIIINAVKTGTFLWPSTNNTTYNIGYFIGSSLMIYFLYWLIKSGVHLIKTVFDKEKNFIENNITLTKENNAINIKNNTEVNKKRIEFKKLCIENNEYYKNLLDKIKDIKQKTVCRKVDNDMVLIPILENVADMKLIYTLNEVGSFIWERIDKTETIEDLIEIIVENFEIDYETASNDTINFFKELISKN